MLQAYAILLCNMHVTPPPVNITSPPTHFLSMIFMLSYMKDELNQKFAYLDIIIIDRKNPICYQLLKTVTIAAVCPSINTDKYVQYTKILH